MLFPSLSCTCHVCSVKAMLATPHSSAALMLGSFVESLFGGISNASAASKVRQFHH